MYRTPENEVARILVADDEAVMRQTLELVLTADGWLVDFARTGRDALDRCAAEDYDLVILDHWMPGLRGLEAAQILKMNPASPPVVVFTACLDPELKELGASIGVEVIDKLNWKELVARCHELLAAPALARVAVESR